MSTFFLSVHFASRGFVKISKKFKIFVELENQSLLETLEKWSFNRSAVNNILYFEIGFVKYGPGITYLLDTFQYVSLHKQMKFSIKNFFSKCDQIRITLGIWSHLRKKSLMENFTFCAVSKILLLNTWNGPLKKNT